MQNYFMIFIFNFEISLNDFFEIRKRKKNRIFFFFFFHLWLFWRAKENGKNRNYYYPSNILYFDKLYAINQMVDLD